MDSFDAERVANQAFEIAKRLNRDHFSLIVTSGSFADLAVCITDFCKISKYQKISLHAIEMLRGLIPQMIKSPQCPITDAGPPKIEEGAVDDPMTRFWFPVLFGFYDIIMNGEDLEVRKRYVPLTHTNTKRCVIC
jgi:brefeldin A-inhibited guanine nucleotide-exchange protein